jgi:hypothetical protein
MEVQVFLWFQVIVGKNVCEEIILIAAHDQFNFATMLRQGMGCLKYLVKSGFMGVKTLTYGIDYFQILSRIYD